MPRERVGLSGACSGRASTSRTCGARWAHSSAPVLRVRAAGPCDDVLLEHGSRGAARARVGGARRSPVVFSRPGPRTSVPLVCLVSASACLGRARLSVVGHRPPGSAELGRLVLPRLCFACAPRAPVMTYSSSTGPGARREHGSRGAAHGSHERGYVRTVAAVCMLFSDAHSDYLDQASTRYKHSPAELHIIVNN